eukprot:tig00000632_g2737.t1
MAGPILGATEAKASPSVVLFWTVSWLIANMCTTLLNKAVFHSRFGSWKFPLTLSACHLLTQATFTLFYVRVAGRVQRKNVDRHGRVLLLFFAALFAANIVMGNSGLRYVTVSFSQICRALVPTITVVLSRFILGKTYPLRVKLSLIPILIGVCLAAYGELNFHILGFTLMMATVVLASLKAIYSNKFLTGAYKLEAFDLLDRVTPPALLMLVPFIFATGEADRLIAWQPKRDAAWEDLPFWVPQRHAAYILLSCAASLWLNYASFRYNQVTSALSITVAGNAKEALTIVVSVFVFKNTVTPLNLFGTVVTICGSCLYSYLQYLEMTRKEVGGAKLAGDSSADPPSGEAHRARRPPGGDKARASGSASPAQLLAGAGSGSGGEHPATDRRHQRNARGA